MVAEKGCQKACQGDKDMPRSYRDPEDPAVFT